MSVQALNAMGHVKSSDFAHGNKKHVLSFGERVSRDASHNVLLHPAFKRPKGRPKSIKRKGRPKYMEKQGKKRIFTCQVCYKEGHTKESCPNRAVAGGPAPRGACT